MKSDKTKDEISPKEDVEKSPEEDAEELSAGKCIQNLLFIIFDFLFPWIENAKKKQK